jgi:hypothetical protein
MTDVTTTITDLVLLAVSSKANLLDSFVSLYAVFVGALHRIIGVEFGMSPPLPTILGPDSRNQALIFYIP